MLGTVISQAAFPPLFQRGEESVLGASHMISLNSSNYLLKLVLIPLCRWRGWTLLRVTKVVSDGLKIGIWMSDSKAHIPFIHQLTPKCCVYVTEEVPEYSSSWMTFTVGDTNDLGLGAKPWNTHFCLLEIPDSSVYTPFSEFINTYAIV